MKYVEKTSNLSGTYPPAQSTPFPGAVELTEEQAALLVEYNGFVTISETENGVAVEPNAEARDAWFTSLPPELEPTPTETEQLRADVDFLAAMAGVSL